MNIAMMIRQNHALEHATVHMLSRRNPHLRLVGRTTPAGFYIYGPVDTELLADAASEALVRLQQGEGHLAVHPRCGTNLAVTGMLAGTAAFSATLGHTRSRFERLPVVLMAATLAAVLAQPLAYTVQEKIMTTPDLDGVQIDRIERQERGSMIIHKVVTTRT